MSVNPESPLASRIRRMQTMVKAHPLSPLFARLADGYLEAGDPERALQVCLEGLKNYPEYASAHVVLAKIYLAFRRYHDARESLKRSLDLLPTSMGAAELYRRSFALEKEFPSPDRFVSAREIVEADGIPEDVHRSRWSEREDLIPGSGLFARPKSSAPSTPALPAREELDLESLAERLENARIPIVEEEAAEPRSLQVQAKPDDIETRPMTETLAAIYVRQEKYAEAARVYEYLMRTHPEREADFADVIRQLRERQQRPQNPSSPQGPA